MSRTRGAVTFSQQLFDKIEAELTIPTRVTNQRPERIYAQKIGQHINMSEVNMNAPESHRNTSIISLRDLISFNLNALTHAANCKISYAISPRRYSDGVALVIRH